MGRWYCGLLVAHGGPAACKVLVHAQALDLLGDAVEHKARVRGEDSRPLWRRTIGLSSDDTEFRALEALALPRAPGFLKAAVQRTTPIVVLTLSRMPPEPAVVSVVITVYRYGRFRFHRCTAGGSAPASTARWLTDRPA